MENGSSSRSFRDALASGGGVDDEKAGSADDRADMFRMGKQQELRVSLRGIGLPFLHSHLAVSPLERLLGSDCPVIGYHLDRGSVGGIWSIISALLWTNARLRW